MRPISVEVIARDAAAHLARASTANCVGAARRWDELEASHRRTRTPQGAASVVAEMAEEFCNDCPALMVCRRWAEAQQYTGLAAGAAYEDGLRMPPGWYSRPGPASKVS